MTQMIFNCCTCTKEKAVVEVDLLSIKLYPLKLHLKFCNLKILSPCVPIPIIVCYLFVLILFHPVQTIILDNLHQNTN